MLAGAANRCNIKQQSIFHLDLDQLVARKNHTRTVKFVLGNEWGFVCTCSTAPFRRLIGISGHPGYGGAQSYSFSGEQSMIPVGGDVLHGVQRGEYDRFHTMNDLETRRSRRCVDPVLDALNESAGHMAGYVDPLLANCE